MISQSRVWCSFFQVFGQNVPSDGLDGLDQILRCRMFRMRDGSRRGESGDNLDCDIVPPRSRQTKTKVRA